MSGYGSWLKNDVDPRAAIQSPQKQAISSQLAQLYAAALAHNLDAVDSRIAEVGLRPLAVLGYRAIRRPWRGWFRETRCELR